MKSNFHISKSWGLVLLLGFMALAQTSFAQNVKLFVRSKAGSPNVYEVGMIASGSYSNIYFNTGQVTLKAPKAGMSFCTVKTIIGDWGGATTGTNNTNPNTTATPFFTTVRNATASSAALPNDYFIIGKTASPILLNITSNTEYILFELTACPATCSGTLSLYENGIDTWDGSDLSYNPGQAISYDGIDQYQANDNRGTANCTVVVVTDTDGDGVSDAQETIDGTNPLDSCSLIVASQTLAPSAAWNAADCDNDGNPNSTDPNKLTATATNDILSAPLGSTSTVNLLANDDFLAGSNISITKTGGTAGGTASFNPLTGVLSYTPLAGEAGTTVTIIYQVCKNTPTPVVCASATVSIQVGTPPTCEVSYFVRTKVGTLNTFEVGMISKNSYNNVFFNTGQVTIKAPKGTAGKQFSICGINTKIGDWGGATTGTNNTNPSVTATSYFTTIRNATAIPAVPLLDDYFIIGKTASPVLQNVTPNTEYILFEMTGCPNSCTGNLKLYENQGTITPDVWNGLDLSYNPGQAISFDGVDRYCSNVNRGTATCTDPVITSTAPVAQNDGNSPNANTIATGNVLTNDDVKGLSVTLSVATPAKNGTFTVSNNGNYVYTPTTNFVGKDSAQYQVCNNKIPAECSTAWVIFDVQPIGLPPTCEVSYFVRTKAGTLNTFEVGMISPNSYNNVFFNTGQVTIKAPKGTAGKQFSICDINTKIGDWGGATTGINNTNPSVTATSYFTTIRNATAAFTALSDDYFIIGKTASPVLQNVTPNTEYILFEMTGCPNSCTGNLKLYENQGTITPDAWNGADLSYNPGQAISFDGVDRYCSNANRGTATCTNPVVIIKPLAINDIATTLKNTPISGNVQTNDNLNGLSPVTSIVSVQPKNGVVSLQTNGSFTYNPNPNFVGKDSLKYKLCNGIVCDSAWVFINVLPTPSVFTNNKPVANADVAVTTASTPVSGNVGNNDIDPDAGQLLAFTKLSNPNNGTLVFNPNGTYTYTPTTGFTGTDVFKYKVCDNGTPSLCDTASVTIKVLAPSGGNDKPVANDDAVVTNKGYSVSGNASLNDSDPNSNTLIFSQINTPSNGTATMNASSVFTYTPNTAFVGTDKFLYKVCDTGSPVMCDTATVSILVLPASTMPIAVNDIATTIKGSTVTGNVLTNDDKKGLTVSVTPVTPAANGTMTLNPDGTFSYIPNATFVGKDWVKYQLCNNLIPAECSTAWLYISVQAPPTAANDKPVANPDVVQTLINLPVAGKVTNNDTDPEGQPLTASVTVAPTHGSLTFNPDGTFTYLPDLGYIGKDKFTYKVCDNGTPTLCDTASVNISIMPKITPINANDKPFAQDDAISTPKDTPITASVAPNDSDPNTAQTLSFSVVSNPSKGTVNMIADGSYMYSPAVGYTGSDKFTYKTCDNGTPTLCDTATVYINVLPAVIIVTNPNTPLAINDINITPKNTAVSGNVLTNDDKKGLPVTVSVLTAAKNGTFVFGPNGVYTYTPATNYVGKDSIQYQLCNNLIPPLCDQAWVYIVVTDSLNQAPTNNPPTAMPDVNQTLMNVVVTGKVSNNDFDPDAGQTLTFTKLSNPSNGSVVFGVLGTYIYTPITGFVGTDMFTYKVCDNGTPSLCDQTTVTIKVVTDPTNGGNLPPVANDDAYTTNKGVAVSGNASLNDNDPNVGQILSFSSVSLPTNGSVLMSSNGTFTYTPTAMFVGTDKFLYKVCDNASPSLCDTATVYISIQTPKITGCVTFNLTVLLQGPYDVITGKMSTLLNQRGLLPGQTPIGINAIATPSGHPYNTAPWNYTGTESTSTYPITVSDWVLVSLRSDSTAASTVFHAAGLLHDDGHITFLTPCFNITNGSYYLVIEHRNHMGVRSSQKVRVTSGTITYDFSGTNSFEETNPPSFGQKLLSNGKYAMYAGDCKKNTQNNNFDINSNDSQLWKTMSGNFDRYMLGDYNFNADIANEDNTIWKANNGRFSGVLH